MTNLDSLYSADKGPYCQAYDLPSSHVQLWELDRKEGGVPKNWCLWTVVLEKTPESPMDSKIKPVNLKGNQPWIFTGKTDAEAPVFWSSDVNSWLIGKVPDDGTDWGQKERVSEDQRAGWHHWCNGHELRQTSGDGEGQGGLVCCSPWSRSRTRLGDWTAITRIPYNITSPWLVETATCESEIRDSQNHGV